METRLFIAALTLFITNAPIRASDVDSEHLFGFTEGADIGKAGEREAETETIGRFGKSAGSYAAVTQNDSLKVVPFDNFRVSANAALAYFQISGVPDLEDRQLATLLGFSLEARYMLMDRHHGPFGLTLIAEPRWGRVDATSGDTLTSYGGTFTIVADKELIDNRLFGALNALFDAQATRLPIPGNWGHDSRIGISSAVSARVTPTLFLGGEVRYLRAYDGLGLDVFSGQALFAGPTFYLQITRGMALSGAWNAQIAGRTAGGGSLDLTHFERQQAKLRFNVNF
ncbi:hypothetical protein [Bradyrhizobium sp. Ec3.3]|uniref:hypothetical protein n=1 Tax=Bradyrhizobium sp. Ec3.3 TaxID=189753 RepID=UPI000428031B|nr:hypothetical protein [Bradyrhizobium sp. Ec3.3]